jgi:hypothetical protein
MLSPRTHSAHSECLRWLFHQRHSSGVRGTHICSRLHHWVHEWWEWHSLLMSDYVVTIKNGLTLLMPRGPPTGGNLPLQLFVSLYIKKAKGRTNSD